MVQRIDRTIEVINGAEVCISRNEGKPLILLTRMASRGFGGWDGIWDYGEMAERLHEAMPQARLEIAKGYGSLLPIEAPEAFAAVSDAFFSNVTH